MIPKIIQISHNILDDLFLLIKRQTPLIVNLPITQTLYDKLTILAPAVWEILVPMNSILNFEEFKNKYHLISVPENLFNICLKEKVEVIVQCNGKKAHVSALKPELAVIYTVQDPSIPSIFIALGMLRHCNTDLLDEMVVKYFRDTQKLIEFIQELASIRLYRTDLVWNILLKYNYQDQFKRLSLYVRDFIKNEFIYQKIM